MGSNHPLRSISTKVLFAVAALALTAPAAHAAWGLAPPTPNAPYEEAQRGSALTDVMLTSTAMVDHYLRNEATLDLGAILSISLHELDDERVVADVVTIHTRFEDAYPDGRAYPAQGRRPDDRPTGGVGLVRIAVDTAAEDGVHLVRGHEVLLERSLLELDLRVRVSIGDTLAVVEDEATGFRRVYPLGVGAIDHIRRPGELSSVTPTTEFGRLDKRVSWEVMTFPKNFQRKPYLPLVTPRVVTDDDGQRSLYYRATLVAFHIWQPPRFARGYLSHGCIRMRDEDLAELAAFTYGVEGTIPVQIVASPLPDAKHPHWKLHDRFYRLENVGTAKKPKYWTINDIWVTEYVQGERLPTPDEIVGITIDPDAAAEVAAEVAAREASAARAEAAEAAVGAGPDEAVTAATP